MVWFLIWSPQICFLMLNNLHDHLWDNPLPHTWHLAHVGWPLASFPLKSISGHLTRIPDRTSDTFAPHLQIPSSVIWPLRCITLVIKFASLGTLQETLRVSFCPFMGFWRDTTQPLNSYSASRDNWCTVGGDGGCRVGEVRAGTTSPMPDHNGFKLQ